MPDAVFWWVAGYLTDANIRELELKMILTI